MGTDHVSGQGRRKGGIGGKALAGHVDMIPRTLATLSRGRKGEIGVGRQRVRGYVSGVGGVVR